MLPIILLCLSLNSHYFYNYIPEGSSICFIGDSITAGNTENRIGWYNGLNLEKYNVSTLAFGGIGVKNIVELLEINDDCLRYTRKFDYYVIAIGANDLRWSKMSPIDGKTFVSEIDKIVGLIGRNKKYIIVSPWFSFEENDKTQATIKEKNLLSIDINKELEKYCDSHGYLYADTYSILREYSEKHEKYYRSMLDDFIHPSTKKGIYFYSNVFLKALDDRRRN